MGTADASGSTRNLIQWSLLLCFVWYSLSVVNNIIAKALFDKFQYPLTLTFVQSACLWLLLEIIFLIRPPNDPVSIVHGRGLWRRLLPLAAGKFVATVASHIALWRVPISFVHTIKASLPIFTVTFGRVLLGERQSYSVYFSLFIICLGVLSTTFSQVAFDFLGFMFAVVSTMMFSLLHIFSKKQMIESKINQLVLLKMYGRLCTFCFLPVWIIVDGVAIMNDQSILGSEKTIRECIFFLLTNGTLNAVQNVVAFSMLYLVTPLTYSVASNMKRIFVIGISIMVFNNPVNFMNFIGSLVAVAGTLLYGRARQVAARQQKRPSKLISYAPLMVSPQTLEEGNNIPDGISFNNKYSDPSTTNVDFYISPSESDLTSLLPSSTRSSRYANSKHNNRRGDDQQTQRSSRSSDAVAASGILLSDYNQTVPRSPLSDDAEPARLRIQHRSLQTKLSNTLSASHSANGDVLLGFGGSKVHMV